MAIDLLTPFRTFFKFDKICTDNNIFRMHYKITVIMLLTFTLVITSKQFFGDPIHCMSISNEKNRDAINSYCWIFGTYTLTSKLTGREGETYIYRGVGPKTQNDAEIKHIYYQWVCFMLLGQAAMFYTPRYLWKVWEGGRLKTLAADLTCPLVPKDWQESKRDELLTYLTNTRWFSHNMYAIRYAICECLNLINAVGQIFLLDIFLGGSFRNYGALVASFIRQPDEPNLAGYPVNPMDQYFPKMTKCNVLNYGPSGGIEKRDRLCVLPLNIVNEKIFIIIWFWLIFISFLSTLAVLFRILVFTVPALRTSILMGQLRFVKRSVVAKLVRHYSFGDWFILYLLGKNMNPVLFKELIVELKKTLDPSVNVV